MQHPSPAASFQDHLTRLLEAGQVARAFEALDAALRVRPGHKLFTVLAIDWARGQNQRVYTSDAIAYPCGGAKPLVRDSEFFQSVVVGGQARICPDRQACRAAFFDHELIEALGCESAVNVPVRWQGTTLGSLNLLHESGWYQPRMLAELTEFAALAAPLLRQQLSFPPEST